MKLLTYILIAILPLSGFAKGKPPVLQKRKPATGWCESRQLPAGLPLSKPQLKVLFDQTDRRILVQSFWGELLTAEPRKILIPLIQYLANTEQKDKVSGYYLAMALAAGIKNPVEQEIETWPESGSQPTKVKANLKELCDLYLNAGGEDFYN